MGLQSPQSHDSFCKVTTSASRPGIATTCCPTAASPPCGGHSCQVGSGDSPVGDPKYNAAGPRLMSHSYTNVVPRHPITTSPNPSPLMSPTPLMKSGLYHNPSSPIQSTGTAVQ